MNYEIGQVVTEDYGVSAELQMWSITRILREVTESADFMYGDSEVQQFTGSPSTWAYVIASKAGDSQTPILAEKILTEGFNHPICIYRTESGGYGLGNGHHRLVCAILLGLDKIPVFFTECGEYYPKCSVGTGEIKQSDEESADMLYDVWSKTYKNLSAQEYQAESEDW